MSMLGDISPMESANQLFYAGDFEGAVKAYQEIVGREPGNGLAWKGLGMSLIQTGEKEKAIEACQKASQLQIGNADCRYAYGYALGADGRFDEAIKELDASLILQPNHSPAKQALIYAIVQHGQKLIEGDPRLAENYLDRALKLDGKNPNVVAPYLELLRKTNQKGKAANVLQHLPEEVKTHQSVAPIIEKMHEDAGFHTVIHQAEVSAPSAVKEAPKPVAAVAPVMATIPCPKCGLQIPEYASICQHCDFRLRATGTFAGRDTGPKYEWQEIALTIISLLWVASAGYDIYSATQMESFIRDFFLTFAIANAAVGLGMLFRVEWVMTVAKILAWLSLLRGGWAILLFAGLGHWGAAAGAVFQMTMAGFLIYLITYTSDA